MLSLDPKAEYADVMERALYNGVLSGMALDGKSFFYVNPLETDPKACQLDPGKWHVKPQRQKWFACACCPPNLARLLANLSEYIYQTGDSSLYVNLFIGSTVSFSMGGAKISVQQESGLPFAGTLRLRVSTDKPVGFKLKLRKPCWCQSLQSSLPYRCNEQGYLVFDRIWKDGDCLDLQLDLAPRRVYASPLVQDCLGKVCLSRGPLIYCLEEADNGKNLSLLSLPRESALLEEPLEGVLEGMVGPAGPGTPAVRGRPAVWLRACQDAARTRFPALRPLLCLGQPGSWGNARVPARGHLRPSWKGCARHEAQPQPRLVPVGTAPGRHSPGRPEGP